MAVAFDPEEYKRTTRQQWEDAAEAWHRWGPAIEAWLGEPTERMLRAAGVGKGSRVLDVAAGAGGQSMAAAARVGENGRVLATDISPTILAYAAEAAAAAGYANLETRAVDGEELDVDEGAFDAVISRLGLMYFSDQQRALAGMRRALRPGGRLSALVYSTPDRNELFSIPLGIICRRAQLPPPPPDQPGPFSLGGPGALEEAFGRAGFGDIRVTPVSAPVRMPSAADCARFLSDSFRAFHPTLAGVAEAASEGTWAEIERELARFATPTGFEGPCELLVASGIK